MNELIELLKAAGPAAAIIGAWLTYRLGQRKVSQEHLAKIAELENQKASTEVEEDKTALAGYQALVAEYRQDHQRMSNELMQLRETVTAQGAQITSLNSEVRHFKEERETDRAWKRLALDYIRTLLGVLTSNGLEAPLPPPGLALDAD